MNRIQYRIDFDVNQSSLTGIKKSLADLKQLVPKDFMRIDPKINLNEARSQMMKMKNSINDIERAYDQAFDSDLGVLNLQKFNQGLNNLDLAEIESRLGKAGVAGQRAFTQLAQSALTTNVQLKQTTNWLDSISKTLGSTIRWGISSRVMNEFVGTIQGAYGYVKELDKSLNDIRIVTGKSADEMRKFAKEANTAAQSLGETTNSYTQASLIYYQQGLSDEETKARAETTLKAANVTGQSGEEVSEQLTAVWNGYKVAAEETELYVDKLAAVAATTASDLEELSTGMSKVASAASTTGVSIDELSAQMSTIISVTRQAPESVGTALKTIYARMTSLELGETDEDGMNLAKVTQSMSDMGIEVLDETGNLRDLGTVIEEVGAKWNTWTEAQRSAMAQTLAGTRQYNNLYALFENWDMYLSALETSQGAAGTLQKQQDTYMESTEYHLDRMAAAAENFQDSLLDDRGINAFADIMTTINNLLAGFTDSIGGGTGAVLNLGAILTKVFKKQIATGVAPILNNIGATKFNKQQFDAVEKNIEDWKKQENIQGKAAKAMLDYQAEMKKYWHLMSDEEKEASMKRVKEIGHLEQLQEEWEKANKAVTEYANSVKATGDTRTTGAIVQDKALQFEGLASSGQALRESSVSKATGEYKDPIKAKEKAKEYKEYLKVYDEYGKKLKLIKEQQKKGVKFSENESAVIKQLQSAYDSFDKKQLKAIQTIAAFADETKELEGKDLKKLNNALKEISGIDVLRDIVPKDASQQVEALTEEIVEQSRAIKENSKEIEINEGKRRDADILRDQRNRERVEAGTELISTLSSMGSLINNMTAIPNIWANNDISDGEKIIQTISNVGMTIASVGPQAMTAVKGIKAAKAAGDTLTLTMSSLNIAALGVGLALGIFSAIKTAIDNNVASIKEKNKATIEETKVTTEQVKANNELYESYKLNEQQYKSGEMTKQELLNTTEDLINAYDIENGHLMRLTGNYEGLSLAIEKARKEEAKYALTAAKTGTTAAKQNVEIALRDHDVDLLDNDNNYSLFLGKNLSQEMQDILNKNLSISTGANMQDALLSAAAGSAVLPGIGTLAGFAAGLTSTNYMATVDASSAAGLVEFYDNLVKTSQELEELGDQADETLKFEINQRIKDLSETMPELKEMVESVGDALILNADAGQKLNLAESSKEASEYIAVFRSEIETLNNELPKAQRLTQDQLNRQVQEYLNNIENAYIQRQIVIEKLKKDANEEVGSILDGLTDEQLSLLLTIGVNEKTTKETVYQMCNTLQEWLDTDEDLQLVIKMRTEGITKENVAQLSDDFMREILKQAEGYSDEVQNILLDTRTIEGISNNVKVLKDIGDKKADKQREQVDSYQDDLKARKDGDKEYQELLKKKEFQDKLDYIKAFYDENMMSKVTTVSNKEGTVKTSSGWKQGTSESGIALYNSYLKELRESGFGNLFYENLFANSGPTLVTKGFILTPDERNDLNSQTEIYENEGRAIQAMADAIEEVDLDKVQDIISQTFDWGISGIIDDIDRLIDRTKLIGEGFVVAAENAQELINTYPELLQEAEVCADGSIQLNAEVTDKYLKDAGEKIKADWEVQRNQLINQIELAKIEEQYAKDRYEITRDYVNDEITADKAINDLADATAKYKTDINNFISKNNLDNAKISIDTAKKDTQTMLEYINDIGAAANKAGAEVAAMYQGKTTGSWNDYVANSLFDNKDLDYTRLVDNIPDYIPYGDRNAWAKAEYNRTGQFKNNDEKAEDYLAQLKKQNDEDTSKFLEELQGDYFDKRDYREDLEKRLYGGDARINQALTALKKLGVSEEENLELLKDIFDIYHNVNVELGLTESHLNKLIDLQEQLTGQELLDNIREQNAYLEKQNQLTKDKYAIMSGEKEMYKQKLLNKGFKFDGETGAISNYWEAMEANLSYVNGEIEKYQGIEGYEDYVEKLEEEYEEMVEAVEKYDELLTSELPGLEAEMREIQKQIVENNIKAFDVEINMHLETKDVTSEWNDFIKDFTLDEDDFVGRLQQDAASGLGEITGNLIGESVQRAKEVQAEIIKMQSGEESEIFGTDMAKAQEKLKELQTEVINNATAFKEYCESIEESYFNLLDNADDRLEEHYSKYEQIQKKLTNSIRMTELVFGENAYGKKAELYEAQQQANVGELDARRREVEMWKQALAEATPGTEEYDRIYAHLTEAQNALEDKVIESLEFIKTKYENAVHKIFDDMNKELLGMSLDNANLEWEFATKMDDTYLDNIEKGYELQKLSYDYEKSKNGLSENALKRINALQAEQMEYLREKENLTQYDIDRANALLDIEMKRIALEEAENNKTSMRLRRDSQGNYSYQFVADQDAINEAKESLADAERNLYDLDKEKFISTSQEMEAYLAEQYERWINADAEGKKIIEEETRKMLESMGIEGQTAYSNLAQSSQMAADSLGLNIGEISDGYMNNLFPQMDTSIAKTFGLGQSAEEAGEKFGSVFDSAVVKLKEVGDTYESEKSSIEESSGVFFNTIGNNASEAKGAVNDLNTATGDLIDVLNTEIDTGKGIYDGMKTLQDSMKGVCKNAADTVTAITNMVKKWNSVKFKDHNPKVPSTEYTTDVNNPNYNTKPEGSGNGGGDTPDDKDDLTSEVDLTKAQWFNEDPYNYIDNGGWLQGNDEIYSKLVDASGMRNQYEKIQSSSSRRQWLQQNFPNWSIIGTPFKTNSGGSEAIKIQEQKTGVTAYIRKNWLETIGGVQKFDTGGYTGDWNDTRGRLAMLHQKELVLNAQDTPRMLEAINITREMQNFIEAMRSHSVKDLMFNELELSFAKAAQSLNQATEAIQQQVQIEANFPDVRDAKEIEEALNNLVNMASQYAYRSKR